MKESIGLTVQAEFTTLGGGMRLRGWKAHHFRPSSNDIPLYAVAAGLAETPAGAADIGIPPAIHFSKPAITASGNLPDGGICRRGSV
jgi:hypothetical protein